MKEFIYSMMVALATFTSCSMIGASGVESQYTYFLPGESCVDTMLVFGNAHGPSVSFDFWVPLKDYVYEGYGKKYWGPGVRPTRVVPSDEIYTSFGDNAMKVKAEFDKVFNKYIGYKGTSEAEILTILYDGQTSLTADKEFAGYQPGANIPVSLYSEDVVTSPSYEMINSFFDLPLDYHNMLSRKFTLCISEGTGAMQKVSETVTFELKIPVKVVMYLNWLNDKISDPDAPVTYEERELYCKFTIDFNLK